MLASILNFAGPDLLVIILIIVLLFGAKRIPALVRGIRESIEAFRQPPSTTRQKLPDDVRRSNEKPDV